MDRIPALLKHHRSLSYYRSLLGEQCFKKMRGGKLLGIAGKEIFHSQHLLDRHVRESLPDYKAYLQKPPEPDKLLEISEKVL